jgi:hypothetical protein
MSVAIPQIVVFLTPYLPCLYQISVTGRTGTPTARMRARRPWNVEEYIILSRECHFQVNESADRKMWVCAAGRIA